MHWAVARTLRDLLSEPTLSVELADLAGRWARLTGEWSDVATWARGLARSGRQERAVAEVSAFAATGPAAIERDTELAELLAGAGRSTESEALLQRLLGKRWLPGRARKRCEALLDGVLRATGRAAEADRRQDEALRRASPGRGTVAFRSAKVAPNDRCPCGSGKKYKRCCAAR
ncbi:MAG: SEC-C domain-containing protein [Deltaproteobacteria bacterium]|nr:SEC-C domain-containing protein [Deltaproteobacteria bacterium]